MHGWYETNESNVYAIGDVAGPPCLVHKASHEAVICVEKTAGKNVHMSKKECIPNCMCLPNTRFLRTTSLYNSQLVLFPTKHTLSYHYSSTPPPPILINS